MTRLAWIVLQLGIVGFSLWAEYDISKADGRQPQPGVAILGGLLICLAITFVTLYARLAYHSLRRRLRAIRVPMALERDGDDGVAVIELKHGSNWATKGVLPAGVTWLSRNIRQY